jgi:hypothetical protein
MKGGPSKLPFSFLYFLVLSAHAALNKRQQGYFVPFAIPFFLRLKCNHSPSGYAFGCGRVGLLPGARISIIPGETNFGKADYMQARSVLILLKW